MQTLIYLIVITTTITLLRGALYLLGDISKEGNGRDLAIMRTRALLADTFDSVAEFRRKRGRYPDSLREAVGERLVDAWSHELAYGSNERSFWLRSAGPNGRFGTGDDIGRKKLIPRGVLFDHRGN